QKEFQFRDQFVMPLLLRLGFGIVVHYHGTREFGRDVIFGDLDRFGHVVYYGLQIKYESSIGLGASQKLIEALNKPRTTHFGIRRPDARSSFRPSTSRTQGTFPRVAPVARPPGSRSDARLASNP
ncbi:MAG: hypothetical protein AB7U20_25175, partial [Planctomycetaceae bacterium]